MKKLKVLIALMLFAAISLNSCKKAHGVEDRSKAKHKTEVISMKYKKGDVIYLKPDSLKVVVNGYCPCSKNKYDVYYFDAEDHKIDLTVEVEMIF